MKTDKPMKIHPKEGPRPLKVWAARRVPKQYEEPVEAAIEDLIKKRSTTTNIGRHGLVQPGFFVAKTDGRARLVMDFTHLNATPSVLCIPSLPLETTCNVLCCVLA